MLTLYRGDDTGGQIGKELKLKFYCDPEISMANVAVTFDFLGITHTWNDVSSGDTLTVFISHTQSKALPLGRLYAKLYGTDSSGKIRHFANRIPIEVTTDLNRVYGSDGLDTQDIHVYASVSWDSITGKPTTFAPSAHTHSWSDIVKPLTSENVFDIECSDWQLRKVCASLWQALGGKVENGD